ncbi:hypothetical protein ACFQ08_40015, partial [Streptosporangium algeriense]
VLAPGLPPAPLLAALALACAPETRPLLVGEVFLTLLGQAGITQELLDGFAGEVGRPGWDPAGRRRNTARRPGRS